MAGEEQQEKQEDAEEETEEVELPDLTKVVGSLDDLVRQGELSRERASFARQKIEDLHTAINKSKAVRRKLTNDSLDLSLRLETEIESLKREMQLQAEDETTLDLLREDGETADNEALLCREKEQALSSEEADLCKAQEDFQKRIKEIEEEHAAALAPQMLQLKVRGVQAVPTLADTLLGLVLIPRGKSLYWLVEHLAVWNKLAHFRSHFWQHFGSGTH